jgi:hypothetical protein
MDEGPDSQEGVGFSKIVFIRAKEVLWEVLTISQAIAKYEKWESQVESKTEMQIS